MNEKVMEKAKELARLIRFSPEYICMMAAQDAAAGEEALEAISPTPWPRRSTSPAGILTS